MSTESMTDITNSTLLTDFYQLNMLQTYFFKNMQEIAVFDLFARRLPTGRNFLVAAGLEQALSYLENLNFTPEELAWLSNQGYFDDKFLDYLSKFQFTGTVHALPEGTVCFANEPLIRITAPLSQAQLVESRLINLIHYQTLIASKAVRCFIAAEGKSLVDFGMRRAHAAEAALFAARATYLAGFEGTATMLAGMQFGIPLFGTMAHSFIQAHEHEEEAFRNFATTQSKDVVILLDTYDVKLAAIKLTNLKTQFLTQGITIKGVRIDSGDLITLTKQIRSILNEGGLEQTLIFVSGDLDEYRIKELLSHRAPIDGFGIGTRLAVSIDAPTLDLVYKLQEYAGKPRRKKSAGKLTWPGRKQIYRKVTKDGKFIADWLCLENQPILGAEPLLQPFMVNGKRLYQQDTLESIRTRLRFQLSVLPEHLLNSNNTIQYPVHIAPALHALAAAMD